MRVSVATLLHRLSEISLAQQIFVVSPLCAASLPRNLGNRNCVSQFLLYDAAQVC